MIRNLKVVKELIKLRLQHIMVFRLGFFGPFFVDGSLFLIQLLVFQVIYSNVDNIGGWNTGEMIVFIGTFSLLNAINMVIYFFGIIDIPNKIKTGDMDLYLTKPINPLLRISFEKVNPGSLPLVFLSIIIIMYGIQVGEIEITGQHFLTYCFLILIMALLYYDVEVIIRTISFFVISTVHISKIEETGLELCFKIPGTIFKGIYKIIFCFLLPYGVMATIPAKAIIGSMNTRELIYGIGIVIVFTWFTFWFWKMGIRKYNSASS